MWFKDELSKDVVAKTDVKDAPRTRDATWVKPRLVGQVAFTEWTADNRLRHPSFLGLRDDKGPEEVVREKPAKKASSPKATTDSQVILTSPDRVVYPRDGITKQDVADYYDAVAAPMMRALKDRPLSLEHWNQGIDKPSWYQQGLGKGAPKWLTLVETPTRTTEHKTVKHLVVDSRESLRWLAQMSVLTIHMWSSRAGSLEEPDWIVFDLDPAKGQRHRAGDRCRTGHAQASRSPRASELSQDLRQARHSRVRADRLRLLARRGERVRVLAGAAVTSKVPFMTVERSLAQRKGRLYLDCMQNGYGKTIVAPYSLRAIDGAPVSAPLKWSEVTKKLDPLKFNLRTMPKRLDKVGDLFEDVLRKKARLPKLT